MPSGTPKSSISAQPLPSSCLVSSPTCATSAPASTSSEPKDLPPSHNTKVRLSPRRWAPSTWNAVVKRWPVSTKSSRPPSTLSSPRLKAYSQLHQVAVVVSPLQTLPRNSNKNVLRPPADPQTPPLLCLHPARRRRERLVWSCNRHVFCLWDTHPFSSILFGYVLPSTIGCSAIHFDLLFCLSPGPFTQPIPVCFLCSLLRWATRRTLLCINTRRSLMMDSPFVPFFGFLAINWAPQLSLPYHHTFPCTVEMFSLILSLGHVGSLPTGIWRG